MEKVYPRGFSHVGISVKEIEKVVKWYNEILGFYILMEPTIVKNESDKKTKSAFGEIVDVVFTEGFQDFKIAHLSTADGVGIEFFEFPETKGDYKFDPYTPGVFHIGVQDPDIEGLAKKIVENGGKQRFPIMTYYPGEKPYRMVYMEDPWGHIVEIYTHSYDLHYADGVNK